MTTTKATMIAITKHETHSYYVIILTFSLVILHCNSSFTLQWKLICIFFVWGFSTRENWELGLYLFFFKINNYFIYLFIFSCVESSFRERAFSSCGKRGPLFIAVRGPLTIAAPPVAGHRLQTCRLSSCGSRAQLLRGMWDLPRPGLEPVSPALAGRFSTTAPPGKPGLYVLIVNKVTLCRSTM